jgi:hypothetical protein
MKKFSFLNFIYNVLILQFIALLLAPFIGGYQVSAMPCFVISCVPLVFHSESMTPQGVLQAGLLKEVWLDVFMNNFYRTGEFLTRSIDMTAFVENNAINLAEAGVDPVIYINNTTYPIGVDDFAPNAVSIPLQWFDTKNTKVNNVLKKQYAFDAIKAITSQHQMALLEKITDKTAHAYSPASDATNTPVIVTSGTSNGSFLKFRIQDIQKLANLFDLKKFPKKGRVLVLHPNHVLDIQDQDVNLFKAFLNLTSGQPLSLYGFDVYVYSGTATYNKSTGVKVAFGAAAAPSTDTVSSLAYCESEVMRAEGSVDMFYLPKAMNTGNRADEIGFQKFHIAMPIRNKAIAAIYSVAG